MVRLSDAQEAAKWRRRFLVLLILVLAPVCLIGIYLFQRFGSDTPVDYASNEEHFKYGSTGGEHAMGFPYWIWRVLPQVCAEHLPGPGYESLGMIFEPGKEVPVGTSQRRYQGVDRVFLNCAVCHSSTVRTEKGKPPMVVSGMPANNFDIMKFQKFFFGCAADPRFRKEYVMAEIDRLGANLDLLDRTVVYPVAIAIMRERVLTLAGRFDWINRQPDWGPGRVDTFNSAKVIFNFPMDNLPAKELSAPADFPSIWNQKPRQGMSLHWDGNNSLVEERNKSAAFGTGTTPPTIDIARIKRVEDWLLEAKPPAFPFAVNAELSAKGGALYKQYCAECHGASGRDFGGAYVGKVTPIADIATDRRRLDSYTPELAVNQGTLYAGYPWRFTHFRKTFGYANMPLDGLWLRAPYLHNGSVPNLRDLLEPASMRPKVFYRGNDLYDPVRVGFVSNVAEEDGKLYFEFDTRIDGNANTGHEGRAYGTELGPNDKSALVEFLKTF